MFITGTILPATGHTVALDPVERKTDYLNNLRYYLEQFDYPIYFLENSAFDFNSDPEFSELLKKGLQILKFPVSEHHDRGKGYQEFEMLDQAMEDIGTKFDAVIKLSGRYRVQNLSLLIRSYYKSKVGLMMDFHRKMKVGITHTFIVTPDFYTKYFKSHYRKANDDAEIYIEHVVYTAMVNQNVRNQVSLFPINPIVTGKSGSYGGSLERNLFKMKIRNVERKVLRLFDQKEFLVEY